MDLSVNDILAATRGSLVSGDPECRVYGISIDSRSIVSDSAFFALKGPNFDGHAFITNVSEKGASAVVVEVVDVDIPAGLVVIKVEDTLRALGDMAAYIRSRHSIPLVAISGSTGKTTTKEMVAFILSRSKRVLKTEGNKNNRIGLPLTLFRLEEAAEAAVVELGISESGEMARLVEIARPDVALITNIGHGHLETLGDLEGVASAKSALLIDPAPGCIRIVNMDDEWVRKIYEDYRREESHGEAVEGEAVEMVSFSLNGPSDVSVSSYTVLEELGAVDIEYNIRGELISLRLKSPAICNVMNGAAAIAAVLPLGVGLDDIKEGLEQFTPLRGRLVISRVGGIRVIDDTYNANPDSMEAALKTLSLLPGRKVAVLGDMLELGPGAAASHAALGRLVAELGIDILVAIGSMADTVASGALLSGLASDFVFNFADKEASTDLLKGLLQDGDCVLVKASRGMGFESVVEAISSRDEEPVETRLYN